MFNGEQDVKPISGRKRLDFGGVVLENSVRAKAGWEFVVPPVSEVAEMAAPSKLSDNEPSPELTVTTDAAALVENSSRSSTSHACAIASLTA